MAHFRTGPLRPQGDVIEIDLAAPVRRLLYLWMILLSVFLLIALPARSQSLEWILPAFLLVVTLLALLVSGRKTLRVDADSVTVEHRFHTVTASFASISRLIYLRFFDTSLSNPRTPSRIGLYAIETLDGPALEFAIASRNSRTPRLEEVLKRIETATGRQFLEDSLVKPASRSGFFRWLRISSGMPSHASFLVWVLGSMGSIRAELSGLDGPGYRGAIWMLKLAVIGVLILAILRLQGANPAPFGLPALPLLGVTVVALMLLGTNALLLHVRNHRRRSERYEVELHAARCVQERLLPASAPTHPLFELIGTCRPAMEIGGDFFDYMPTHGDQNAVMVADVSGKGLPAGLFMTFTKGCLMTSLAEEPSLVRALSSVNRRVKRSAQNRMFVTLVVAVLPNEAGLPLRVVRAGHNPPLLVPAAGDPSWIRPMGIGLGLDPGPGFERSCQEASLTLEPGDALILYSDGLTESMDPDQSPYGEARLLALSHRLTGCTASQMLDAVLEDVASHRRGAAPSDDLTLVVIRAKA